MCLVFCVFTFCAASVLVPVVNSQLVLAPGTDLPGAVIAGQFILNLTLLSWSTNFNKTIPFSAGKRNFVQALYSWLRLLPLSWSWMVSCLAGLLFKDENDGSSHWLSTSDFNITLSPASNATQDLFRKPYFSHLLLLDITFSLSPGSKHEQDLILQAWELGKLQYLMDLINLELGWCKYRTPTLSHSHAQAVASAHAPTTLHWLTTQRLLTVTVSLD